MTEPLRPWREKRPETPEEAEAAALIEELRDEPALSPQALARVHARVLDRARRSAFPVLRLAAAGGTLATLVVAGGIWLHNERGGTLPEPALSGNELAFETRPRTRGLKGFSEEAREETSGEPTTAAAPVRELTTNALACDRGSNRFSEPPPVAAPAAKAGASDREASRAPRGKLAAASQAPPIERPLAHSTAEPVFLAAAPAARPAVRMGAILGTVTFLTGPAAARPALARRAASAGQSAARDEKSAAPPARAVAGAAVWLTGLPPGAPASFVPTTVTGADGSFVLRDVPAGTYTLHVHAPRFGEQRVSVTVRPGGEARVFLPFTTE